MEWGYINRKSVGMFVKVNGRLDVKGYVGILENALIPSTHTLSMPRNWIFQQDNATCHTSRLVQQWFHNENVTVMEWPAQSPDLDPIENMWDHLKRFVHEKNPANMGELWTAINDVWKEFRHNCLVNLIDTMPRRCEEVIKAKGGRTNY